MPDGHFDTARIHAFGKVILFGEHAVVFGCPSLAAGIPGGIKASKILGSTNTLRMSVPAWNISADRDTEGFFGESLRRLSEIFGLGKDGFDLILDAGMPLGAGMGSSAALSVALVKAAGEVRRLNLSDANVRAAAHDIEMIFHGRPSGLDDTMAVYGGVCLFKKDGWNEYPGASCFPALTTQARQIDVVMPEILIANTGEPKKTFEMVTFVRERFEKEQSTVKNIFRKIEVCVLDGLDSLLSRDLNRMGTAMTRNHVLLGELGVSTPGIEDAVSLALSAGAAGAKMTGAGGGGCVIALCAYNGESVLDEWRKAGLDAWRISFNSGSPA